MVFILKDLRFDVSDVGLFGVTCREGLVNDINIYKLYTHTHLVLDIHEYMYTSSFMGHELLGLG